MKHRRPTHPGELLREEILHGTKITQGELAKRMGVSRRTVNEICQERRGDTADMAHRLARVLNTTPDMWMNMQAAVDIWDAPDSNDSNGKNYQKIKPPEGGLRDSIST
jgi:addiction module HigA family antidote